MVELPYFVVKTGVRWQGVRVEWCPSNLVVHFDMCLFNPYPTAFPYGKRYGSTLLPATREQHDKNYTQSH